MECFNTVATMHYHAEQEEYALHQEAATESVRDISEFLQKIFTAVNGVLTASPALAKHVDARDLRENIEIVLLQGPLDNEIAERLSDYPEVKPADALDYDMTK